MKTMYVGPTIPSVATRNTVYEEMPEPLKKAAKAFPYLAGLCVPISELRKALDGNCRMESANGTAIFTDFIPKRWQTAQKFRKERMSNALPARRKGA